MTRAAKFRGARNRPTDVYSALADSTRRQILDLLADGDKPVHELSAAFDMSRPAISQHLRVLKDARLVRERRVGRERHYRLRAAALREVAMWLAHYERFWDRHLVLLGKRLDELKGGP